MKLMNEILAEKVRRPAKWQMFSAAILVVLFAVTTFMRFYSRTVTSGQGEMLEVVLPDGSSITLNSRSFIKYHPLWWYLERRVTLEGEAFLEVLNGGVFEVVSGDYITSVTGTSFNILSRGEAYEVACAEGSVRVLSLSSGSEVLLIAGQKAIATSEGGFIREADEGEGAAQSAAWMESLFYFTSAKLTDVFNEIEREYGIEIRVDPLIAGDEAMTFTGYFPKANMVEDVLDLVCIPFGIRYKKTVEGVYQIISGESQE